MNDGVSRIVVSPGISQPDLHWIWEEAKREARKRPGSLQVIVFRPGNYPLPEEGVFVYKDVPTILHSSGMEVRFRYLEADGELQIAWQRTLKAS
jgi:hypothetical protein